MSYFRCEFQICIYHWISFIITNYTFKNFANKYYFRLLKKKQNKNFIQRIISNVFEKRLIEIINDEKKNFFCANRISIKFSFMFFVIVIFRSSFRWFKKFSSNHIKSNDHITSHDFFVCCKIFVRKKTIVHIFDLHIIEKNKYLTCHLT